jgi:hypothetical protein
MTEVERSQYNSPIHTALLYSVEDMNKHSQEGVRRGSVNGRTTIKIRFTFIHGERGYLLLPPPRAIHNSPLGAPGEALLLARLW